MADEDIIFVVQDFVQLRENAIYQQRMKGRPVQRPWSKWAIEEILWELRQDETRYPDEVIRNFISLMDKYEEIAEPGRKELYRVAGNTARDLYSYVFEEERERKEITELG